MSEVRASIDAYNAGDEGWIELYAPDVEAFPDASVFPEAGPLHGRDEFRSWVGEINSAWIAARWETTECYALGCSRPPGPRAYVCFWRRNEHVDPPHMSTNFRVDR